MSHLRSVLQRCNRFALIFNGSPQRSYSQKSKKQAHDSNLKTFEMGKDDSGKSPGSFERDENMLIFARLSRERKAEAKKKWKSSSRATMSGRYAFGRPRQLNPVLNPETVSVLECPQFNPSMAPTGFYMEDYSDYWKLSKVYLVGTNHMSKESRKDVKETILQTQADVVLVELCPDRFYSHILKDELKNIEEIKSFVDNPETHLLKQIKHFGLVRGFQRFSMYNSNARVARELGVESGGEFRAAFNASLEVPNCQFVLGDRPYMITQKRLFSQGTFTILKNFFSNTNQRQFNTKKYGKTLAEQMERMKKKDAMEEMKRHRVDNTPRTYKIHIEERDQYMTFILHKLLERTTAEKITACKQAGVFPYEPVTIVAVVGLAHVAGIKANWNTKLHRDDFLKLLRVPTPSRIAISINWESVIKYFGGIEHFIGAICTILIVLIFAIAYVCYRRFAVSKKGNEELSKADEELLASLDEEEF